MTGPRPVPRLLRRAALVALAVAVVGGAATTAIGLGGNTGSSGQHPAPANTTTLIRKTLVDQTVVTGRISYGNPTPVISQASGTVTWLPTPGAMVSRGEALLRIDDRPLVLLYGALPMYRQLTIGTRGEDVKQFTQNLNALGYTGFTVDTEFTAATARAVKRWQAALERDETGTVEVADVIYAEGRVRIATQSVRVGATATGEVLTVTSTTRVVTADVALRDQRLARVRNAVTVRLPGGREVPGRVTVVGAESDPADAAASGNADTQRIPVVVSVADKAALDLPDDTEVTVRYVAQTRVNVLTVSVGALLAIPDGGYGLEIRDGAERRVVPVRTGLFAEGQVEVSGDGLVAGTVVGVAA
ncbi:peptidoglycan-binding protein [Micromonospora sp. NPDC049051]|uniref:peptidoglycan-binding protein n=1 Tax=Micromonospora sp. NPDC049051 TaxID=3364264 RepID=UPI00371B0838